MPISPRDRRALIIFGAVTVVAVAVFFLFIAKSPKKVSTASRPGSQLNVNQPTPTPSPTKAKKKQKKVRGFSGRRFHFGPRRGAHRGTPRIGLVADRRVQQPSWRQDRGPRGYLH